MAANVGRGCSVAHKSM